MNTGNLLLRALNFARWPIQRKIIVGLLLPSTLEIVLIVGAVIASQHLANDASGVNRFGSVVLIILALGLLLSLLFWALLSVYVGQPIIRMYENARTVANRPETDPLASEAPIAASAAAPSDELRVVEETFGSLTEQIRGVATSLDHLVIDQSQIFDKVHTIGMQFLACEQLSTLSMLSINMLVNGFPTVSHARLLLRDLTADRVQIAASGAAGTAPQVGDAILSFEELGTFATVFGGGTPLILQGDQVHGMPGARSECALPLNDETGVLGILDLYSTQPFAFGESDVRAFGWLADQLAVALRHVRQLEAMRAQLASTEESNRRLIGQTWGDYAQRRRRTQPTAAAIGDDHLSALQQQAIESRALAARREGEMVRFAVPILLRGQPLGAVEWEVPTAIYTENARRLATELTNQLATAAENARLFEQSQQLVQREREINSIGTLLAQQTDVSSILQVAVKELGRALKVSQTAIVLSEDEG